MPLLERILALIGAWFVSSLLLAVIWMGIHRNARKRYLTAEREYNRTLRLIPRTGCRSRFLRRVSRHIDWGEMGT